MMNEELAEESEGGRKRHLQKNSHARNRPSKKSREEEHMSIKMLCNFLSNSIKVQKRFLITFRRLVGTIGKGQSTRSSTKREHMREEGVYFTQRSEKQMNITIYDVNYK